MTNLFQHEERTLYSPWSADEVLRELGKYSGAFNPRKVTAVNRKASAIVDGRSGTFLIRLFHEGARLPIETLVVRGHVVDVARGARIHARVSPSPRGLLVFPVGVGLMASMVTLIFGSAVSPIAVRYGFDDPIWLLGSMVGAFPVVAALLVFRFVRAARAEMADGRGFRYLKRRLSAFEIE